MLHLPESGDSIKKVQDMKGLRKAFDEAEAEWKNVGGHIIIENSTLECDGKLLEGKFDSPLIIRASSIGGCTIEGEGKFGFKDSSNVWIYGINFENNLKSKGTIEDCKKEKDKWEDEENTVHFKDCKNCVIAGCNFHTTSSTLRWDKDDGECYPWYNYLGIGGGDCNYVSYNNFHDKAKSRGHFLWVSGEAKRTVIEYNYFRKLPGIEKEGGGIDKGEAIKLGDSAYGNIAFASITRYNLFEDCEGDTECVTNKSCCNIYHHNTFRNNNGSLCFRHGSFNIARNNVFIGNHNGIRLYGTQLIKENYWESSERLDRDLLCPLVIGCGSTAELNKGNHHFQVKDSRFEKNVILAKSSENEDKDRIVIWGHGDRELKPKDSFFRDNHILARSGTMLNRDNEKDKLEVDLDKYFTDNILYNQGSAKYGDILTRDNGNGQCRPPPQGEPEAPKVDILEDKDVGPHSERVDHPHFSREELHEIIEEFREILEDKEEHELEFELGEQFKSILSESC